jgi:hypothetical protein
MTAYILRQIHAAFMQNNMVPNPVYISSLTTQDLGASHSSGGASKGRLLVAIGKNSIANRIRIDLT